MPLASGPPPPPSSQSSRNVGNSTQIPLRRPTFSHGSSAPGGLPIGGHSRVPSNSSSVGGPGGGGGGTSVVGRARQHLWVVLGKKGRGFAKDDKVIAETEDEEEDEWVTVGLERNIQAQVFALANALGIPSFPNLCLEVQLNGMRARITGEEMFTTIFHQFLFPSSSPPPTSSFSPFPIAALLELRLLPASFATPPRSNLETEPANSDEASARAKEAWKGGVRKLSLLAGRGSEGNGLHETVHRWKTFALPPLPPSVPSIQQPTPIPSSTDNASLTPSAETVDATVTTPPPSPYDPASYSYSISSLGPQSPLPTPASGWASPAWNVAVSVGVADIAAGSCCMTPSTATSWGVPSPGSQAYQFHVGLSPRSVVATPDIGYRNEGSRPCTPSTATSWGAPSPPLGWDIDSPTERVLTPSIGERVALTPLGLEGRGWESRANFYEAKSFLDLGSSVGGDGSSRLVSPMGSGFDENGSYDSSPIPPRSAILPPSSPPASPRLDLPSYQRTIRIDTSAPPILPLTPPKTLESPERPTSLSPFTPPSPGLITRRKAAPSPIMVPVSKPVPGLVLEKRKNLGPIPQQVSGGVGTGLKLARKVEQPPLPVGAVEVVQKIKTSSRNSSVELKTLEVDSKMEHARVRQTSISFITAAARSRARSISPRGIEIASATSVLALPALSEASQPAVQLPKSIRIMLSNDIVYPFANGIYPPARRSVVENGQLSGVLDGLDRVKETTSASVPLFRFGYPFYSEVDSLESTPRTSIANKLNPTPIYTSLATIRIMLDDKIAYPFAGGFYPSVVTSSSVPRTSKPLPGIRILLSKETGYPFAKGLYPALRRTVVENGQLSGALEGLDRVKQTASATLPLFRFGFPYFVEVDSSTSTPRTSVAPRPIRILSPSSASYPITSSMLYPPLLPASIRILHGQQSYPLTTRMLYPPPVSRSIRILHPSAASYPITSESLYPTPIFRPVKIVGSRTFRQAGSNDSSPSLTVASRSSKPQGIRIMLSDKIIYPFANGIYPPARRILVENGELSGALEGLDRLKESRSATVPLFRFGFPFYIELDSSEPTPLPSTTTFQSQSIRILEGPHTYPILTSMLYPPLVSRSIRILRKNASSSYPITSADLYPPPVSRSLRIIHGAQSYPPTTQMLYPLPISRSLKILDGQQSYPLTTGMLYPPPVSRSLRILDVDASYPIETSDLYPTPLSRSLKILAGQHSYPITTRSLYPPPVNRSLRILLVDASYPLTTSDLYPTPLSRSIRILGLKQSYPLTSEMLYPSVVVASSSLRSPKRSPTNSRNHAHLQIAVSPITRSTPAPRRRAVKTHLMLHLEVVRTMLLSPLPPNTPTPPRTPANAAVQPQPVQPSTTRPPPASSSPDTVLGRTPSFARVNSHLPTRANRAISSYAPSSSEIPPVPHLPESIHTLRPMTRSMSTRRPGLESLPERSSTLNRSVSQATPSTRTARPMSNRYEGLTMGGGGNVGARLRGPPPPGPPPQEPLPSLPQEPSTTRTPMPRRQSLLVSQRMSQLMGNGGDGSSNANSSSPRPAPASSARTPSRWV